MTSRETRHSPVGESLPPGVPRTLPRLLPPSRSVSLISLSHRLSARDYVLASLLADHRVLTTDQITAILFQSPRTCINRLRQLRRIGFLDRFRPVGSARTGVAWHWLIGALADRYVALAREQRPLTAKMLGQQQDAVMASPQLRHLVGANQFFIDLLADARSRPDAGLLRWWPAPRTAAAFARRVHPDGHGVWREGGREVGWFLEHDTGTEDHNRLVAKLDAYRNLRRDGGPDYPVLFWLPTRVRETHLHQAITPARRGGLTVATAARDNLHGHSPAGPVWRLAGNGRHRLTLVDLGGSHGTPGPYTPGPPTPDQNPLHLLTGP